MPLRARTAIAAALAVGTQAAAQLDITWINPAGGPWSNPDNWDAAQPPDNDMENARIGVPGVYTVSLDGNFLIHELRVFNGSAILDIPGGRALQLAGTIHNNDAIIRLNPTNLAADSILTFNADAHIGGAGLMLLGSTGPRARIQTAPGVTVTNGPDHTILGAGQIAAGMANDGFILADRASAPGTDGRLSLVTNTKHNRGLIGALADSILNIESITLTQDAGALLLASPGQVRLSNATVAGGVWSSADAGVIRAAAGICTVSGVMSSADVTVDAGATLAIDGGGFTNDGEIRVNPAGSATNAVVNVPETTTIAGSGELSLFTGGDNAQLTTSGGAIATNGPAHTISGIGIINADLINQGTVAPGTSADGQATLTVLGAFTNDVAGTIEIGLAGALQADRDLITGTAVFDLAGTLDVVLLNGFVPARGSTFDAIIGASVQGEFDRVNSPAIPGNNVLRAVYLPDRVRIVVRCAADLDGDGDNDADDFFAYLDLFEAGDRDGDLDGDGDLDSDDFFAYLDLFAQDC